MCHHLVDILTEFVGIKMGHNFIKDARGAIWTAPMTSSKTPLVMRLPATVGLPGLTFEPLLGIDLALAQRVGGQTW